MVSSGRSILKKNESSELSNPSTPSSLNSKHVKWDEEKLIASEAIKMTIPKGQIDEPKTPYQHGQYGSSCEDSCDDEYANFQLKADEGGDLSDESFRSSTNDRTREDSCESVWESSVSEFETAMEDDSSENRERDQRFKANRAQHYFMKQALQHGKELLETDDDSESENETHNGIGIGIGRK